VISHRRAPLLQASASELVLKGKGRVFYVGENQHRELAGGVFHTSLHAEMHSLFKNIKIKHKRKRFFRKGEMKLEKMTIYVARLLFPSEKEKFILGNSMPCQHCQKYLSMYNVRKIKYTDVVGGKEVLCELKIN
jgi:hypothetical protein